MNSEFNLLDEPWILVTYSDDSDKEVSLLKLFDDAHRIKTLNGESTTQNVSILRLCLAVLYTVVCRYDISGCESHITCKEDAVQRWSELWNNGEIESDVVNKYLDSYRDRFYLFDSNRPFYQDAALGKVLEQEYKNVNVKKGIADVACNYLGVGKLIGNLSESGNKRRLFRAINADSLKYDEAARWLINYMNIDDKSIKKPTPKVCGNLGEIGCTYLEGDNLFETLMLNLVFNNNTDDDPEQNPAWEDDSTVSENEEVVCTNLSQLYTFQCRRIYLDRQNGTVVGFKATAGRCYDQYPKFEPMTAWRKIENKDKTTDIVPKKNSAEVHLWRNMQILIADGKSKPGVVDWISELEDEEIIDEDFTVQVRTVGLEYGTMTSSIANTFSDELDFAAVILQKVPTLRNSIIMQIDITKLFAEAFASFAAESFLAKGGDKGEKGCNITNEKKKARADFYASIDVPFRDWLSQVGVRITTEKEIGDTWWGIVKEKSILLAKSAVSNSPESAVLGKNGRSIAAAYNWFLYKISSVDTLNKEGSKNDSKK